MGTVKFDFNVRVKAKFCEMDMVGSISSGERGRSGQKMSKKITYTIKCMFKYISPAY